MLSGSLAVAVVSATAVLFAQDVGTPRTATYITKAEIDAVNKLPGTDRAIKVVNIGHENFALGIIHRGPTGAARGAAPAAGGRGGAAAAGRGAAAPAPTPCGQQLESLPPGGTPGLIFHENQTEGYLVVSGGGTLMTGGYIVNGRRSLSPDLNGPTCGGGSTYGDITKRVVSEGDIIIIPAGVPHGWTDITDHVDYLSFRPSPGILTAGWTSPAIKK
jgi:mannose-6-phosphate isomerase-like protein (cupin superfamily)